MSVRNGWLACIAAASLFPALPATAAVVLQYHHVGTSTPPATSIVPDRFAMHLDYLEQAGFEVVRLQELVDAVAAGGPLPDRAAAITFDDGYRSIYEAAWPLLQRRGWPFTVFVNPAPHDNGSPLFMSWDQLREMAAGGATIANHTVNHPHLLKRAPGQDDATWQRRVRAEITGAQQRIREEIGTAPLLFAWPFGEFDAALLELLGELGFTGFGQQSGPLAVYSDLRALPRFPFGGPYGDRDDFVTKVESLPMPLAAGADSVRLRNASGQPLGDAVLTAPARPVLMLQLAEDFDISRLACYASGQGRAILHVEEGWVRVQAERPLSEGRARYNCTAPSAQAGRYHWFSQSWIIRKEPHP